MTDNTKALELDVVCGNSKKDNCDPDPEAPNTSAEKYLSDEREGDDSEPDSVWFLPKFIQYLDQEVSDKVHRLILPIYVE